MPDAARLYGLKGLVTGAADGIGEAIARTFAKHGAEVLAVDGPRSGIETTYRRTRRISVLVADEEAEPLTPSAVADELGGLDILVNNYAGLVDEPRRDGAAVEPRLERMLARISAASESLLPLLKKSPAGRIINVGCLRSSFGREGGAQYQAAERALAKRTAELAAAVGRFGTTVNYLQPGAVMTPASRAIFDADKAFRDWCIAASAAKRLGDPIDVAKVALFLATDDSVFVSGTGIAVDGGAAGLAGGQ